MSEVNPINGANIRSPEMMHIMTPGGVKEDATENKMPGTGSRGDNANPIEKLKQIMAGELPSDAGMANRTEHAGRHDHGGMQGAKQDQPYSPEVKDKALKALSDNGWTLSDKASDQDIRVAARQISQDLGSNGVKGDQSAFHDQLMQAGDGKANFGVNKVQDKIDANMVDEADAANPANPMGSGGKISDAGKSLLSGALGQSLANLFAAQGKADQLTPAQSKAVEENAAKSLLGKSDQEITKGLQEVSANAGKLIKDIADYQTQGSPISADTKDALNKTADAFDAAGRPDLANLVRDAFAGAKVEQAATTGDKGGANKPSDTDRLLGSELATSLSGKEKFPGAQELGLTGKQATDFNAARDSLKIGRPATGDEAKQVLEAANRVANGTPTASDVKGMKLASDALKASGDPQSQKNAAMLDKLIASASPASSNTKTADNADSSDDDIDSPEDAVAFSQNDASNNIAMDQPRTRQMA